ncbi:MAG: hypothetical protein IJD58_09450 [Lachnospiraceae bacterium]|nr:hypothetical protein [Lachnospiraceae bacterium]
MNNENWKEARKRRKNLLIVEGNHEKNELFGLIFKCFPEISIDMEDVWIYGTNIYMLYEDIVKEYDVDWDEQDVDLPYVISKKKNRDNIQYKNDFTNIILVFDYEHHDPNFDEDKILKMQKYFTDSADVGRLYINYPMIESYQHLEQIPDNEYENRQISVTLQPGVQYKNKVKDTVVAKSVDLVRKMREILTERFSVMDDIACSKCVDELLSISNTNNLIDNIESKLKNIIEQKHINTAKHQFKDLISKLGYINERHSYWIYMREMINQIVIHNICKANKIQNGIYPISSNEYKKCFEQLDLDKILQIQNEASRDEQNGYIWVLNTCVFVIADYNFSLVLADK